jgi:NADH-quinone oxidoreductase subunit C
MSIFDQIKQKFPDFFIDSHAQCGDDTIILKKNGVHGVLSYLKEDPDLDFNILMDLTAVDYLGRSGSRFEVVYHFYSLRFNRRLRVKALVNEEDSELDSVASLWPGADWYEREVWDMFGIRFKGHPNLKRILMYDEFKGHPLRKDYPVNKRQPLVGPVN